MKIAIISDIHSNLRYLTSVLVDIDGEVVDQIYCLGDLVGYYDEPDGVISLIRERKIKAIKGNHDKYLLGELDYNLEKDRLYNLNKQKHIISENNLEFLTSLPSEIVLKLSGKNIYMTHSLPSNCEQYIYNVQDLSVELIKHYDYYFLGHTHIPLVTMHYGTYIINPGSVGQPRDYTNKPSYAIVDLVQDTVLIKKVSVDNERYIKELESKGYDNKLIDILNRGKNE